MSSDTLDRTAIRRPASWVAIGMAALAIGMLVFPLVAMLLPGGEQMPGYDPSAIVFVVSLASAAAYLSMVLTGAVLAIVRPRNVVGWLLLVAGFSFTAYIFVGDYANRAVLLDWPLPGYRFLDWLYPVFSLLGPLLIGFWVPMLFPDGRLLGRRWQPPCWWSSSCLGSLRSSSASDGPSAWNGSR